MNQLDRFLCQSVFQLGIVGMVGIGFHRVGQGIHARGGRGVRGQAHRQFRVQHRVLGNQEGVVDGGFAMSSRVGDDGCHSGFRTGTGSGGNGHKGRDGPVYLQQSLQLRNLFLRVHRFCGNALGAVDSGAAAQGNQGLTSVFLIGLKSQFHIVAAGVGMVKSLQGIADSGGFKAIQQRLHLSPAHHAGAGNHQNIIDVLFLQERTQFPDFARAFQIGGHTVTHEIIAHFQNRLKGSAP